MTLEGSRERSGAPYDRAACGLLTLLANGTIVRVNQTFCTWFGLAASDLIDTQRMQDLLTMGCKIFHQTHWLPLLQMQGSVAEVQLEFVHRDGHAVPTLVNAVQHVENDVVTVEVAVFVAADRRRYERELLHARRRAEGLLDTVRTAQEALSLAEARLRLALDSAQMIVWDVNAESGAMLFEQGVQRLLGLPEREPIDDERYRSQIHPDDREAERAAFTAALAYPGTGLYLAEYRLVGADGIERVVSSRGRAFRDAAGQLLRFSGILQDETTRRRAEELLKAQERQSRERAVLSEQLVGIVSHDLRTPLQAVSLGANLLASSALTPVQSRTVNRISAAAQRANRLIVDLLDFTQARLGGGIHVTRSDCDVHAVVAEVIEELKLAWPGRMLEHRIEGAGSCVIDPDRISQIVTNLATNALTYGRPECVVLVHSAVQHSQFLLEVHNDGPPIPPHVLGRVFEPLRRGEQQVKLGSRSVGLGLYIVQEIAAAHAGHVTVQSSAEQGTTFSVCIPR
jgi:sigma-B regulation protein RsbU (phosphoserine phosphatase)